MPHHKSAAKRLRTNEKARQRNRGVKSRLKGVVKIAEEAAGADLAATAHAAMAALDRAAAKGVIPKGRADRKKSRLAKRANRVAAAKE